MRLFALIDRARNDFCRVDGKVVSIELDRSARVEDLPQGCDPGAYFWTDCEVGDDLSTVRGRFDPSLYVRGEPKFAFRGPRVTATYPLTLKAKP